MIEKTKLLPLWRELTKFINNNDSCRLSEILNAFDFKIYNSANKIQENVKDHFINLGANEDYISFDIKIIMNKLCVNPKNLYSFCLMYEFVPQNYDENSTKVKDQFGTFIRKITKRDNRFAIDSENITYIRTFDFMLIKILDFSEYRYKGCVI